MKRSALPFVRGRYARVKRCRIKCSLAELRECKRSIAAAVVAHHPLDADADTCKPRQRSLEKRDARRTELVLEHLDVPATSNLPSFLMSTCPQLPRDRRTRHSVLASHPPRPRPCDFLAAESRLPLVPG